MSHAAPALDLASRRRVLLVDDDALDRHRTAHSLSHGGYEVVAVATVATALEQLSGLSYDAVIAETCLGDGTGFDVFHAARERQADLPVVFLGSDSRLPARIGAIRYVCRSADPAPLLAALIEVCGGHRSPDHPVEPPRVTALAS